MAVAVNLRRMLHRKSPEFCTQLPLATLAGGFIVSDKTGLLPEHDATYYIGGMSVIWNYSPDQDAWLAMPVSGALGVFGAGACGEFLALSAPAGNPNITATAGTTTTVTTALTLARGLGGHQFRVIAGTGVGYSGLIESNTLGANAIITLETASGVAFDNTTQFQMFGGSLWYFNPGAAAVGLTVYDRATNAWTARSVTGLPTAWITEGQLVSTQGAPSNNGTGFVNGTSTGSNSSTTLNTGKTWLLNQWANYQVRIISGTGAGQIRAVASNTTGGVATVSAAWTVTPDATSVYRVEGNDDYLYLLGNAVVAMYRYSISGNSWTTVSPGAARASVPGGGMTGDWIDSVQSANWNDESYGAHYLTTLVRQNGRYIYSFRGLAGAVLDVFDIAAVTWVSTVPYGNQGLETFSTGSCSVDLNGKIYIQKDITSRIFEFDVAKNLIAPYVQNPVPQGAVLAGDKMFIASFVEGATKVNYLYTLGHTRAELTRWLMI